MHEPEASNGGSAEHAGTQPPPGDVPPPPTATPAPSGWALNQPVPDRQTYWGEAEPPRQPPPPGTEYAGVGRRFVAWLIDLVPVVVLAVILLVPMGLAFFDVLADVASRSSRGRAETAAVRDAIAAAFGATMPGFLRMSALLQLWMLVYSAGTWLLFGRSPGMALLGIRIVREEDGGRPGPGRVAVRYAGYLLSGALLLIGYIWAIFDGRKQAWHDKLAGTLVVRDARPVVAADQADVSSTTGTPRRPSIGALTETAWLWYRRSPDDVLSSLAFILIPATIVLIPLIAALYATGQDQTRETLNGMLALFTNASDPTAIAEYNLRSLAASAPAYAITALFALVSGVVGTLILGACAAAYANAASTGPAPNVGGTIAARLPALTAIGLVVGVASGMCTLLIGLPAIGTATTDGASLDGTFVAVAALTLLIATPVAIYLSVIWILAVVAIVREDIGAVEAVQRARALARSRTRWLLGVVAVSTLIYGVIVLPIGTLPVGLLSEAYLDGNRLPIVLAVSLTGALTLFSHPALFLVYVEAHRAARVDAAREPLAS